MYENKSFAMRTRATRCYCVGGFECAACCYFVNHLKISYTKHQHMHAAVPIAYAVCIENLFNSCWPLSAAAAVVVC